MSDKPDKVSGVDGEKLAAKFLKQNGFAILRRNWAGRNGEIDLIAREKDTLVFVEVKTRASATWGGAEEAVNKSKQRKLILTAKEFAHRYNVEHLPMRFDVIAIETDSTSPSIRHYQDAFYA